MGPGLAIIPEDSTVYASFDGLVSALFKTKHAVGLTAENGAEVLIHIGIDTVHLNGLHFTAHVHQGDTVKRGQPLITFDYPEIIKDGYDCSVIVAVTNGKERHVETLEPNQFITLETVIMKA